jgi:hypothetical protein
MSTRLDRIKALQKAAKEYVDAERKRLTNEAEVLKKILEGRLGGNGLQPINTKVIAAVAEKDLAEYLKE